MSQIRAVQRSMTPIPRSGGLSLHAGDVVATLTAIGQEGLSAALQHLLHQFPNGFNFDYQWTGHTNLPVDERGKPLPDEAAKALHEKALERAKAAGKILRPKPQPGVVNQEDGGILMGSFPLYTIVAIAPAGSVPKARVLPEPDPRNSPNGDLH